MMMPLMAAPKLVMACLACHTYHRSDALTHWTPVKVDCEWLDATSVPAHD
jgi:hypothetical protein